MLKKMSIRLKITLYSTLLLTACCILLTCILNYYAFHMADVIDAVKTVPAQRIGDVTNMLPLVPSEAAQTAKWVFGNQSILYMLLIIFGGSVLTYYVFGKALLPLQKLNTQVKNMTISHLSETLSVTDADDEIAELTYSFNEMTDKLNEAFLTQQRFSANAAHELRTPLAVLQTKVDVFKKNRTHTPEEYDVLVAVFEKQISRLRSLIKTLLDMTNIDDIREQAAIPLKEVFEDIMSELSSLADSRHITLSLSCSDCTVRGSLDLLYRAFYNLIENGIKYNKEGGTVSVTVTIRTAEQVEILICDTGIGIPNEMKKHIFEPFFRVDKSRSREMGGAGLGLAMAEQIISRHNGSITVSDNEHEGSCFRIVLPSVFL